MNRQIADSVVPELEFAKQLGKTNLILVAQLHKKLIEIVLANPKILLNNPVLGEFMQAVGQIAHTLHNALLRRIPTQRIVVIIYVQDSQNGRKFDVIADILHILVRVHCVEMVVAHL